MAAAAASCPTLRVCPVEVVLAPATAGRVATIAADPRGPKVLAFTHEGSEICRVRDVPVTGGDMCPLIVWYGQRDAQWVAVLPGVGALLTRKKLTEEGELAHHVDEVALGARASCVSHRFDKNHVPSTSPVVTESYIVAGYTDGYLAVWLRAGPSLHVSAIPLLSDRVCALTALDGDSAAAAAGCLIRVCKVPELEVVGEFRAQRDVKHLAAVAGGRVAAGCVGGFVEVFDLTLRATVWVVKTPSARDIRSLCCLPTGELAAADGGPWVRMWEASSGRVVPVISGGRPKAGGMWEAPSGRLLPVIWSDHPGAGIAFDDGAVQVAAPSGGELVVRTAGGHARIVTFGWGRRRLATVAWVAMRAAAYGAWD